MGSHPSKPKPMKGRGDTLARSSGGPPDSDQPNARLAAAEAAERRMKAAQSRGTSVANPNRGQLAAKVEASKSTRAHPESKQEDRLVWD